MYMYSHIQQLFCYMVTTSLMEEEEKVDIYNKLTS
jgi:hypothetical protein